jgi:acetolactate synthase-1/2/3 large subunit
MAARTGGELVVDSLLAQGVTHAFGVPGESYLALLDALHDVRDRLRFIVCRHEGGAAYMGEAYGKLTGRPGVVMVTRGPGASNAAVGIHTAAQDSTPLIVLVGQVGTDAIDREAFQEVDYRRMYGSIVKWAAQVDRVERLPEYVAQAFRRSMAGRPGPVVLALPEDVLTARAEASIAPRIDALPHAPAPADVATARRLLAGARAPLCIVGGRRWDADACDALRALAEGTGLPIACGFRSQDLFDNRHPLYAGDVGIGINPRLAARVRDADVLLVVGERLGEMTTSGYTLLDVPTPRQRLIHAMPGVEEIGRVFQPALGSVATPGEFLRALGTAGFGAPTWRDGAIAAHRDYDAWRVPRAAPGDVDPGVIVRALDDALPDDAIVTNGAGNYAVWLHRAFRYRQAGTQLAPYSGSMGYGVPSAVAAKALHPSRVVVSWNGDGCFLMNGQEIATAVQHGLAVIFVVVDNGMYGTIRMHQERHYPGRVSGTDLVNPDFAALARAYGAHAETVRRTDEFMPAFARARASGRPALLHVLLDPQALTPNATLDALRAQGEAARGDAHPATAVT